MGLRGRKNKKPNDEKGQATVEFALTLILLMAFVFFFLQLSLVFAWGSYVQYATFMSARAYMAAGPTREDQAERAKSVIIRMVKRGDRAAGSDRFPSIARGVGGEDPTGFESSPPSQFNPTDPLSSWMEGVRYTFRSKIFMIPMGGTSGGGNSSSVNSVTLTSESWLGREPAFDECVVEMGRFPGIYDNGC